MHRLRCRTHFQYSFWLFPALVVMQLCGWCGLLQAQQAGVPSQSNAPTAANAPIPSRGSTSSVDSDGIIGPGDQLVISVGELDEVKNQAVRVATDGTIDLPLIGVCKAEGLTVEALRKTLAFQYARYVNQPRVAIQLASSQTRMVSVLGEVNNPGMQEISGSLTLLGALSKAGGIRSEAGPQVIVTRDNHAGTMPLPAANVTEIDGHSRAVLPLDDLLAEKAPQDNILLRAGDVVTIPKGSIVYVMGEVHRAGGFPLHTTGHVSLIEALALAEGLGPNARANKAKILRVRDAKSEGREEIPVNIGEVLAGKKPDPQLVADDILFVPGSAAKSGTRRAAEAVLQVATGVLIYR